MKLINKLKKLILPDYSNIQVGTYWLNKDSKTEVIKIIRKLKHFADTQQLSSKEAFENKPCCKQCPLLYSFGELKRFYKPKTNFVKVPDKKYPTPDYPYYPPIPVTCDPSKSSYKFTEITCTNSRDTLCLNIKE